MRGSGGFQVWWWQQRKKKYFVYVHVCVHACLCVCTFVFTGVYACVCMCVYMSIIVCICVHAHIWYRNWRRNKKRDNLKFKFEKKIKFESLDKLKKMLNTCCPHTICHAVFLSVSCAYLITYFTQTFEGKLLSPFCR